MLQDVKELELSVQNLNQARQKMNLKHMVQMNDVEKEINDVMDENIFAEHLNSVTGKTD
jgi:uncharacterized protein YoxC